MSRKSRWKLPFHRIDRALYGIIAASVTLAFARAFYGHMRVQTGGEWSAPLDDVFIHFDYARSIARGHPFEWSEGNGFSSGATSLTYPFVLAIGYWAGFRGPMLVVWAAIVACSSMLALLLAARELFRGLPAFTSYLAPFAIYSIGALVWSIFSGLEIAFYLGLWGAALVAMYAAVREEAASLREKRELLLGLAGALLVLTRPEGATSIAVLGIGAALARRREGLRPALRTLFRSGSPAALSLTTQLLVNRWLTGEAASDGAIAKLIVYNPFSTASEKVEQYLSVLHYVVFRNVEHHFADAPPYGWIVPLLAFLPLLSRRTRASASLLWASLLSWLALVALNGEARWQNERYTMPAVAWLLLSAALGVGLLLSPSFRWRERTMARVAGWAASATAALLVVTTFAQHQAPRMREQIWFFARASRNIRDQQTTVGRLLRRLDPPPRRVLVNDAGAITYAADIPGLDLLGLGGYGGLPFARAKNHGIGASIELLERIPPEDRPDYFALYPSWWGSFPSWFGSYVIDVPVHGNVICGGLEKVIYRASWDALGTGELPRTLGEGEEIADELDVGDLVSEREHGYEACRGEANTDGNGRCGTTDARLLPDPLRPARDIFDAGRWIHPNQGERFSLARRPEAPARLIVRTVGDQPNRVDVLVDGERIGTLEVASGAWQEPSIDLPETGRSFDVELIPRERAWVNHHVWVTQPR